MDPTTLANNPIVKKLGRFIFLFALVEIAVFILVCYLTSFSIALVITLGFTILGYSIKPFKNPFEPKPATPQSPFASFKSVRKLAGTLFMIPGFLTDIAAILVLLPPVRMAASAIAKKIAKNKLNKLGLGGLDPSLLSNLGNMASGGFGGLNPDMFAGKPEPQATAAASSKKQTHSEQRRAKRERHKQAQTVDVDYEVRDGDGVWIGGKAESPTDLVVKMKHDAPPKVLEPDVIDVQGEWK